MTDNRGRITEDRFQRTEVRGQKTEGREHGAKSEARAAVKVRSWEAG